MATGYTYNEGKVLGTQCMGCKEEISIKYCVECNQTFCRRCTTTHQNVQSTSFHNLVPVEQQSSYLKKSDTETVCTRHKQNLSIICETCLTALCTDCKFDHRGHKLLLHDIDVKMLHTMCAQRIPGLLELLQKLESMEEGSREKLDLYKTAREIVLDWKERLLKIVTDDSDGLLNEIEMEIKKHELLLSETAASVNECIKETDNRITQLSNARKVSDENELLKNLYKSDEAIVNAKKVITALELTREKFQIDEILPTRKHLGQIEKDLHAFLTMTKLPGGTAAYNKPQHSTPKKIAHTQLRKITGYALRVGETNMFENNDVTLYDVKGREAYILDTDDNTIKTHTCDKNIYRLVKLSPHSHIIRDSNGDFHVGDDKFRLQQTMPRQPDFYEYQPYAICRKSNNTFIVAECRGNFTTRLREVVYEKGQFNTTVLCEVPVNNKQARYMSIYPNGEFVLLSNGLKELTKVHLPTGDCSNIDLSLFIDAIECFCVDQDGCILVCDYGGNIHKIENEKYVRKLPAMKCDKKITGITVRKDKIVVVSENNIHVFQ